MNWYKIAQQEQVLYEAEIIAKISVPKQINPTNTYMTAKNVIEKVLINSQGDASSLTAIDASVDFSIEAIKKRQGLADELV